MPSSFGLTPSSISYNQNLMLQCNNSSHTLTLMRPLLNTVAQLNTQIREAVDNGFSKHALVLYKDMKQNGLTPNKLTFPFVAKACAKMLNAKQSQLIHADILKLPFCSDIFVGTALINMYVKTNQLDSARKVFDEMPERDITSWNALLLGLTHTDLSENFLILFNEMRLLGVSPDTVTVIGLIQCVTELKDLNLVRAVHGFGTRVGMMSDVSLANTFISGYGKCRDSVSAIGLFSAIDHDSRTIVSWNSLIAVHALSSDHRSTSKICQSMLEDGIIPDISSFLSLLSSCGEPEALTFGKQLHKLVIQMGCDYDVTVVNTLLTMYSKCGDISSASHLFSRMTYRTCVSWTIMISCYAEHGNLEEAFKLFMAMEGAGEKPDFVTLLALLSGCGQTGSIDHGTWLHNYVISNELRDNVMVCNAIIDMYAKCGCVDRCRELFNSMSSRTIVSWTAMISALALNGELIEALDLFYRMINLGLKPNQVTFLTVLQACVHAGFLDKGWECFDLMTRVHKMSPWLEHYSCMMDLLGRRGKLKEVVELIKSMPFKADAGIWGALLAACRLHHNLEIGQYSANQLFELEPQAAVSYVELANLYASAGRWDGVSEVRAFMNSNEVKKFPGQSIIQVNGKSYTFRVEERCHPEGLLIYEVLHDLALQMKENPFLTHTEDSLEHEMETLLLI